MSLIKDIKAREILDSRGTPTIEVDVISNNNSFGRAAIPSGASTGLKEALELRDNEERYNGKGVLKAINNVLNIIKPKLIGIDVCAQKEIDELLLSLDGTDNKSNLGANALLAVSLACLKCAANYKNVPLYKYIGEGKMLPYPMMNILNGGAHADNNLDFQEFLIIPNRETFKERLRLGAEVFACLKKILKEKKYTTGVGDEGGFAPNLNGNCEALDLIVEAITKANYIPGKDIALGLDIAASTFYNKDEKIYQLENKKLSREDLINYYIDLINKYPIISIEDAFDENDFEGFKILTEKLGKTIQLVGDDLFVTNKKMLQKGIDMNLCNAILIKPNQIGTYSEMVDTINLAKISGYNTIISHRSGETEDTTISDIAVGLNIGQIKTGSLSRSERVCKYNQLLRIEEELNN
jgi:enolase